MLEFSRTTATSFALLFFSLPRLSQLSDERFPICTSIFSLHSLGYYTPQRVPRILPLGWRGIDSLELASLLLPWQSSHSFLRRVDGRANSFKSRCGPKNSANPLRIHRAPLANSSLAPNVFLSAYPFTAHRARARLRLLLSVSFYSALLLFSPFSHPISYTPIGPFSQLSDSCRPFLATRFRISRKYSCHVVNDDTWSITGL